MLLFRSSYVERRVSTIMDAVVKVIWLGIATGAISLLLTKASIFNFLHDWLEKRAPFLGEMLSCPWCCSHWVALFFTLIYHPLLISSGAHLAWLFIPIDFLVTIMVMVVIAAVTARIIYSAYRPIMG